MEEPGTLPPSVVVPVTTVTAVTPITPFTIETSRPARDIYRTWWFWTAVGVIVAGTGVAIAWYAASPDHPEADFGPFPMTP